MRPDNDVVLVVDDDDDLRAALADALRTTGREVLEAANGAAALALLRTQRPRLIVLDHQMPVLDGVGFRAAQLADQKLKDIPVLLVTGTTPLDAVLRLIRPDGVLAKPVGLRALLAVVELLLQRIRGSAQSMSSR